MTSLRILLRAISAATLWNRLKAAFQSGVSDWFKRGYEQQGLEGTWLVID